MRSCEFTLMFHFSSRDSGSPPAKTTVVPAPVPAESDRFRFKSRS